MRSSSIALVESLFVLPCAKWGTNKRLPRRALHRFRYTKYCLGRVARDCAYDYSWEVPWGERKRTHAMPLSTRSCTTARTTSASSMRHDGRWSSTTKTRPYGTPSCFPKTLYTLLENQSLCLSLKKQSNQPNLRSDGRRLLVFGRTRIFVAIMYSLSMDDQNRNPFFVVTACRDDRWRRTLTSRDVTEPVGHSIVVHIHFLSMREAFIFELNAIDRWQSF